MHKVLNHRLRRGEDRTFEAFTNMAYPSTPERSFSSIILDGLSILSVKKGIEHFRAKFTEILLSIWSQCVEEKYVNFPTAPEKLAANCSSIDL